MNDARAEPEAVVDGTAGDIDGGYVDDVAALTTSLAGLSRLGAGHGQRGLADMLTYVAQFAVAAIPGADGAGLALLENGRSDTIVATAPFVNQVDAIQYGLGEGPCISAAATGTTVRSGDIGRDRAWPRFGVRVARLGVHSVLSLPLIVGEQVLGAMNIYAHPVDAFDERAQELGQQYAVPAAISVQNAQVLFQAQRLAGELQTAMVTRAVIDQAVGIVMSRSGCGPSEAFDRLRAISQRENTKLSVVSQRMVDDTVRRVRAHRSTSS